MDANRFQKLLALSGMLWLLGVTSVWASPFPQDSDQEEVVEFADRYERSFAKRDPLVGTMVADVTAYDENGEVFSLKQTRGKPTVLVFGCLT